MNLRGNCSLYEYLYRCIRHDIAHGTIAPGEKLPSKRNLAKHLGVSLITVEAAYQQLAAEGTFARANAAATTQATLPLPNAFNKRATKGSAQRISGKNRARAAAFKMQTTAETLMSQAIKCAKSALKRPERRPRATDGAERSRRGPRCRALSAGRFHAQHVSHRAVPLRHLGENRAQNTV